MEVLTLIPVPSFTFFGCTFESKLDVYEKKVAMINQCSKLFESGFIDLWLMEEVSDGDGKSWGWTKKYSIGHLICTN